MSSPTTPTVTPGAPTLKGILAKLSADEIGQALTTLQPVTTAVNATDGTPLSLFGIEQQFIGVFTANQGLFVKISIVDLWNAIIAEITEIHVKAVAAESSTSGASA